MNLIKRVLNSSNDTRVALVNGRVVAIIRKNPNKGYAVDHLYSMQEYQFDKYSEARDAALSAPQFA